MSDLAAKDLEPAGNIKNHSHRDLDRRNADEDFHAGGKHKPSTVEYGIEPNAAHPDLTSARSLDKLHPDADFKLGARVANDTDKGIYGSTPNPKHPGRVAPRDLAKLPADADWQARRTDQKLSDMAGKDLEPAGNASNYNHRPLESKAPDEDFHRFTGRKSALQSPPANDTKPLGNPSQYAPRSLEKLPADQDWRPTAKGGLQPRKPDGFSATSGPVSEKVFCSDRQQRLPPDRDWKLAGRVKPARPPAEPREPTGSPMSGSTKSLGEIARSFNFRDNKPADNKPKWNASAKVPAGRARMVSYRPLKSQVRRGNNRPPANRPASAPRRPGAKASPRTTQRAAAPPPLEPAAPAAADQAPAFE